MFKFVCKVLAWTLALLGALSALAYWDKATAPEYIEIYSDDDDEF
jgi:hypothetical protein